MSENCHLKYFSEHPQIRMSISFPHTAPKLQVTIIESEPQPASLSVTVISWNTIWFFEPLPRITLSMLRFFSSLSPFVVLLTYFISRKYLEELFPTSYHQQELTTKSSTLQNLVAQNFLPNFLHHPIIFWGKNYSILQEGSKVELFRTFRFWRSYIPFSTR